MHVPVRLRAMVEIGRQSAGFARIEREPEMWFLNATRRASIVLVCLLLFFFLVSSSSKDAVKMIGMYLAGTKGVTGI